MYRRTDLGRKDSVDRYEKKVFDWWKEIGKEEVAKRCCEKDFKNLKDHKNVYFEKYYIQVFIVL